MHKYDILKTKVRAFQSRSWTDGFTYDQLLDKYEGFPVCYLTGKQINLLDSQSYHLDHRKPVALGGTSTLDNCEFACCEANLAKGYFLHEDFLTLCSKIHEHHNTNNTNDAAILSKYSNMSEKSIKKWLKRGVLNDKNSHKFFLLVAAVFLYQMACSSDGGVWRCFQKLRSLSNISLFK